MPRAVPLIALPIALVACGGTTPSQVVVVAEPPSQPRATLTPAPPPEASSSTNCKDPSASAARDGSETASPPCLPTPPPPPAATLAPAPIVLKNNSLVLPTPVVFNTGTAVLRPEADSTLRLPLEYLTTTPHVTLLRIEGHTDGDGAASANQALSEKRALAVARWLVAHGIDCNRLLPVGFGQVKPIASNTTAEGKQQNRRIVFVNAAIKGKPVGGMPVDGGGVVAGDPCK